MTPPRSRNSVIPPSLRCPSALAGCYFFLGFALAAGFAAFFVAAGFGAGFFAAGLAGFFAMWNLGSGFGRQRET